MDLELFEDHLRNPRGLGLLAHGQHRGNAGGAACGDLVEFRVEISGDELAVGFDAEGCGALTAAASAAVELGSGRGVLAAAEISTEQISQALGGLSASKIHAAELVCDAFHRALGSSARTVSLPAVAGRSLIAMSGGVDSALAAALVADHGEAIGVTLELWRDGTNDAEASCCSHVAVRRARALAHAAGLPHFTLDLREEFRVGVVEPWVEGYSTGATPNPCVQCNGRIRIEPMASLARGFGADRLVTGHYARLIERTDPAGPLLVGGVDPGKDQAYALARVPADVLAMMDFPLGELTKTEVRAQARARGLSVAETPDSQDLCFIAGLGRERFLEVHAGLKPASGPIRSVEGELLGTHRGHFNHTVGQRRGLAVGGGSPLYVTGVDAPTNTVTVGRRDQLLTRSVEVVDLDLRRSASRISSARLRHRARAGAVSSVEVDGDRGVIHFSEPVDRVAPGQIACLLDGETLVGCATVAAAGA